MGDLHGRVRVDRRRLRQLRHRPGRRPGRAGGRLRPRMPAAARVAHLRDRPAPAEDFAAEALLMDAATLIAILQEAVPGAVLEAAPTVDLQTTIYASRDDVLAICRVLRDRDDLRFAVLSELTAV